VFHSIPQEEKAMTTVSSSNGFNPVQYPEVQAGKSDGKSPNAVTPKDLEILSYNNLPMHAQVLPGTQGTIRLENGQFHYTSQDIDKFHDTGNELHVSVAGGQSGRAWDKLVPILLANPDVARHFSITENGWQSGLQITIYESLPNDGSSVAPERMRELAAQITQALREADFVPGSRPYPELKVNDYLSCRDLDPGGSEPNPFFDSLTQA
jgi:hypothetical protein